MTNFHLLEGKISSLESLAEAMFPFGKEHNQFNIVLLQEVRRLFDSYPYPCVDAYFDRKKLTELLVQDNNSTELNLSDVGQWLKKNRKISLYRLSAFLTKTYTSNGELIARYDAYKSLVLHICAALSSIGNYHDRILTCCDSMRFIADGRRAGLLELLPDIQYKNLESIQRLLAALSESSRFADEVHRLERSIEDIVLNNSGYTRNTEKQRLIRTNTFESEEGSIFDINAENTKFLNQEAYSEEEHVTGLKDKLSVVKLKKRHSDSRYVCHVQSAALLQHAKKSKLFLSCDSRLMTDHETRVLLDEIFYSIKRPVSKKILLMLLTATAESDLKELTAKRNKDRKITGFSRKMRIPAQKQESRFKPILTEVESEYWLPLPKIAVRKLSSLKLTRVSKDDVSAFLKGVNKKHNTDISMRSVCALFECYMKSSGSEQLKTAYIKGINQRQYPALYYTNLNYIDLFNHYLGYLDWLARISENIEFKDITEYPVVKSLGSPLYFDDKFLRKLLSKLKQEFCQRKSETSHDVHNKVTLYVQMVLGLSSGYRPVSGWYGTAKHLHLRTLCYWISDKQDSVNDNSRFIILPEVTTKLLSDYFEYSRYKANQYKNTNTRLMRRYDAASSGEEHLFFYLSDKKDIVEVVPSSYQKMIKEYFPLQDNWTRHYIRSYLSKSGIHTELIDAYMGHSSIESLAYLPASSLSRLELSEIAQKINKLLVGVGVNGSL